MPVLFDRGIWNPIKSRARAMSTTPPGSRAPAPRDRGRPPPVGDPARPSTPCSRRHDPRVVVGTLFNEPDSPNPAYARRDPAHKRSRSPSCWNRWTGPPRPRPRAAAHRGGLRVPPPPRGAGQPRGAHRPRALRRDLVPLLRGRAGAGGHHRRARSPRSTARVHRVDGAAHVPVALAGCCTTAASGPTPGAWSTDAPRPGIRGRRGSAAQARHAVVPRAAPRRWTPLRRDRGGPPAGAVAPDLIYPRP